MTSALARGPRNRGRSWPGGGGGLAAARPGRVPQRGGAAGRVPQRGGDDEQKGAPGAAAASRVEGCPSAGTSRRAVISRRGPAVRAATRSGGRGGDCSGGRGPCRARRPAGPARSRPRQPMPRPPEGCPSAAIRSVSSPTTSRERDALRDAGAQPDEFQTGGLCDGQKGARDAVGACPYSHLQKFSRRASNTDLPAILKRRLGRHSTRRRPPERLHRRALLDDQRDGVPLHVRLKPPSLRDDGTAVVLGGPAPGRPSCAHQPTAELPRAPSAKGAPSICEDAHPCRTRRAKPSPGRTWMA